MLAYISQNADNRIIEALRQEGFEVRALAPFSVLEAPVDTHADMLLCAVGDVLFIHKDYHLEINSFNKIIKIDEPMSNKYPSDVLLNIAIVGKHVFTNTKHASKTVLKHLEENGFTVHSVAQGYAHCSTCIVSDNAIITSDKGIFDAAKGTNADALLISSGHISLEPYEYGFIGGACGITDSAVYFCGALKYHPEGKVIKDFCVRHGKRVIELIDAPLSDVGGILFK